MKGQKEIRLLSANGSLPTLGRVGVGLVVTKSRTFTDRCIEGENDISHFAAHLSGAQYKP